MGFDFRLLVAIISVFGSYRLILIAKNAKRRQPTTATKSVGSEDIVIGGTSLTQSTCQVNPFAAALRDGKKNALRSAATDAESWLTEKMPEATEKSREPRMKNHTHDRFFPFEEMAPCGGGDLTCIGGECGEDEAKIACGIMGHHHLKESSTKKKDGEQPPCVIYSIGSNNHWKFEIALGKVAPRCEIHTFDCVGPLERFEVPHDEVDNLHFHHVCIGTEHADGALVTGTCHPHVMCGETWTLEEMQRKLDHKRIDLFKMDVEGFEWPILESWPTLDDPRSDEIALPMQVLVEVHYRTQFKGLAQFGEGVKKVGLYDWKFAPDVIDLQEHLLKVGYTVSVRDDNHRCPHCTELTLIRTSCPSTGFYSQENW